MLKQLQESAKPPESIPIRTASFPVPFSESLSYGATACGGWPLVQMGLLMPEAHLIFICPQNCLRGVVLVAAEMQAAQRFSTVTVTEQNVIEGDLETLAIEGVSQIIDGLSQKPPAVLVFTNCIHHFVGTDLTVVYQTLRARYPEIQFTDCYMNPILRKSGGLNPEQKMRQQLYSLLQPQPKAPKVVNILGNRFPMDPNNDLSHLLRQHGFTVKEITTCPDYTAYQSMATACLNITTVPMADAAGKLLKQKLGQPHLALPMSFDFAAIQASLQQVGQALGFAFEMAPNMMTDCETQIKATQALFQQTPIVISAAACPQPLSLAKLLLTYGFNVTTLFADRFMPMEKATFSELQRIAPDLKLYPLSQPGMRLYTPESAAKVVAIGIEAAYFTGTSYFVPLIEGAGLYGFDGITHLMQLLTDAFSRPKDRQILVQIQQRGRMCCG